MDAQYVSDCLYHFVGNRSPKDDDRNFDVLCKVLESRCVSHAPPDVSGRLRRITVNWDQILSTEELVVPEVTCYADIPFEALGVHVGKYGRFGLAFGRTYLAYYGARPVSYIPIVPGALIYNNGEPLLHDIEVVYRGFEKHLVKSREGERSRRRGEVPDSPEGAAADMNSIVEREFLAFLKPFRCDLSAGDPSNFYMEREWRMLGSLKFQQRDVLEVVVSAGFEEELCRRFPDYLGIVRPLS